MSSCWVLCVWTASDSFYSPAGVRFYRGHQWATKVAWWKTHTLKSSHMPAKISSQWCVWTHLHHGHLVKFKCVILATLIPIRNRQHKEGKLSRAPLEVQFTVEVVEEGALWKVNVNGTLKAKVKTVIKILPTAPLIYSQSVARLWICSILRRRWDFHLVMSHQAAACPNGDAELFVFASQAGLWHVHDLAGAWE